LRETLRGSLLSYIGHAIHSPTDEECTIARDLLMLKSQDSIVAGSLDNDFLNENLFEWALWIEVLPYSQRQGFRRGPVQKPLSENPVCCGIQAAFSLAFP
jgi:hypothetical protein